MNTPINVILIFGLEPLLWKISNANSCNNEVPYQVSGFVLVNHVIQSLNGISSSDSCLGKCSDVSSCHSINWYISTGLCQINSGTHLSYPEGLVPDLTGRYMLYSGRSMVSCSNKMCGGSGLTCLVESEGRGLYRCQACASPLGMQDGRILDSQVSASSFYSTNFKANYGRLERALGLGSWSSKALAAGQYLRINLITEHIISKVATQGQTNHLQQWVTKYKLMYGPDNVNYVTYQYHGYPRVFIGNTDTDTVVTNTLETPVTATWIKFFVLQWHSHIAMRVELYGCRLP